MPTEAKLSRATEVATRKLRVSRLLFELTDRSVVLGGGSKAHTVRERKKTIVYLTHSRSARVPAGMAREKPHTILDQSEYITVGIGRIA